MECPSSVVKLEQLDVVVVDHLFDLRQDGVRKTEEFQLQASFIAFSHDDHVVQSGQQGRRRMNPEKEAVGKGARLLV